MGFLRVVEVFPPLFPLGKDAPQPLGLEGKVERFVEEVRGIRDHGDLFLVANIKNPAMLKLSTVEAAFFLQDRVRVRAAPVIVVRDMNRLQFLSTIVTAVSFELDSLMIAWGDKYPSSAKVSNVRDFATLAEAIREAASVRRQARAHAKLLAPVDLNRLSSPRGIAQAKERLRAGAEYLLAQPPTTDAEATFDAHSSVLEDTGLKNKVMLCVFPFRGKDDVRECERYFGWKLPPRLHQSAAGGERVLEAIEKGVVSRLKSEGFPGVYLATRGTPAVAERILT